MARKPYSQEKFEQIRTEIVSAALEIFTREGDDGLSLRKIAEETGVSHTKMYSYFNNKNELLEALTIEMLNVLEKILKQADDQSKSPIQRLRLAGRALIDFAVAHPSYYVFLFSRPIDLNTVSERGLEMRHAVFNFVVDIANDAYEKKLTSIEPLTLANLSWAALHGLITLEFNGQLNEGRSLDELATSALELLFAEHLSKPRQRRAS
ncbi:MAG: TetR/AcrR family transcriptional regulator [Parvibaculaceae bacterium]